MMPLILDRSTPIGQSINAYLIGESNLEDHVIHLLFAANRWEAAAQIRRDIAKGTTIVIDRYYYSGIVYSAAKDNPELALEWARQPEVGLPRPDVCILLDISPEDAVERGGFGSEKYENRKMQVRVRELFGQLLSERQEVEDITVVDAAQSLEDVEEDVWRAAEVCFENLIAEFPLRTVKPWLSFDG